MLPGLVAASTPAGTPTSNVPMIVPSVASSSVAGK
jgi:hypothetical protein